MNFFKNINKQLIAVTFIAVTSIHPCHGNNDFNERLATVLETKLKQIAKISDLCALQGFMKSNNPLFKKIGSKFCQLLLKEMTKKPTDKPLVPEKQASKESIALVNAIFQKMPLDQIAFEIKCLPATLNVKITINTEFIHMVIHALASELTTKEQADLQTFFGSQTYTNLRAHGDTLRQTLEIFFAHEIAEALQDELRRSMHSNE